MHDTEPGLPRAPDLDPLTAAEPEAPPEDGTGFTALRDEVAALVEDARTYAEAEIAFQKTRAGIAGKRAGRALGLLVVALVLLHIALIALAVGAVIALAPLVTIWGAIGIVVGVLLAGVAALVVLAAGDGRMLAALFGGEDQP
jgi:tetrahydromethanopterin S-methyltransferase subunit G